MKAGDRLETIAASFGVTVDDIMRANGLQDRNYIWTGQRLVIPAPRR